MERMWIQIRTESPVVFTAPGSSLVLTESRTSFRGSVLRGMLAGQYIQQRRLGTKAHEDETFRRLFCGGLRFVDAQIVQPAAGKNKAGREERRAIAVPLSLMKSKGLTDDGKHGVIDILQEDARPGYKTIKGLAWINENGQIIPADVKQTISFHMSRSSTDERLGGHSQDGNVYTYESIVAGQNFSGEILGEKEDLKALKQALGGSFTMTAGRSKYTQYGQCRVSLSDAEKLPFPTLPATAILRLDTPLIPYDGLEHTAPDILQAYVVNVLNKQAGRSVFSLGTVVAGSEEIENFVGIWNLRRPRQQALQAGSVFSLRRSGEWTPADAEALQRLLYGGIGDRTAEGFGQLRLWTQASVSLADREKYQITYDVSSLHSDVQKIVRQILEKKEKERLHMQAFHDAQSLQTGSNMTHFFGQLEALLDKARQQQSGKPLQERLQELLSKDNQHTVMDRHLRAIRLSGRELYDYLKGAGKGTDMPYDLQRKTPEEDLQRLKKLAQFSMQDDDAFYEYWRWFFRHSRKKAVQTDVMREGEA